MTRLSRVVVVGGSVAAVTSAATLRSEGFDRELVLLSAEELPPYSRVPLSKGLLAGVESPADVMLPPLPDDVQVRLGSAVQKVDLSGRVLTTSQGEGIRYDGLVIATGARARRLASRGQRGERVVRDLQDALDLARAAATARSAVIVGAGFLGMEIASTLTALGLQVTVVDREPGLVRVLGPWLAERVRRRAVAAGVRLIIARHGVALLGSPVAAVDAGEHGVLDADLVVTAVGDRPNAEWLTGSGLRLDPGVVMDRECRVTDHVVAAGDVACVDRGATTARTAHWTSAVSQGRQAALTLLGRGTSTPDDPYFWTSQFGLDIRLSGLPASGEPTVVDGDVTDDELLLRWDHGKGRFSAASVNYRIPVVKLKRLGAQAAGPAGVGTV